ncbi:uncharacterized protein CANTADRAFT_22185 [Suhomyces tanzawaensis NRRL Y-17324]|uniref:FAM192A/Fyv6 N-terminal domain-containing protein n=1 Tax=Suhomyces tanzawaensis NRRL Y-17324 TaxID=984487 RepID=A0A1E4SIW3_9ASCO|nr:uncharacterized protein CANTADRAFT_22185 [Suhomyces tanzawaensis NRRL Y-17324]ODV79441.1 hypothetical protein CANTADRAFT_22185 [Suhomyces tanzawaensis NRRL Y-17324]
MPDFVKEGEAPSPKKPAHDQEDHTHVGSFVSEESPDDPPRKTLHDQLKEHRDKKQLEFEQQMAIRNSSFKLDEESAKFYEKVQNEALEKEQRNKREVEEKLAIFKQKKNAKRELEERRDNQNDHSRKRTLPEITPSLPKKLTLTKKANPPPPTKGVAGLGAYSSEEDE